MRFDLTILLARQHALDGVEWQANILAILSEEGVKEKVKHALECDANEYSALIKALLVALEDPYEMVRKKVVIALGYLGNTSPEVIDALLLATSDSAYQVRQAAIGAFGCLCDTRARVMDAFRGYLERYG